MSMADEIDSLRQDLIQSRQSSDSLRGTIANLDTKLAAVREFFFFFIINYYLIHLNFLYFIKITQLENLK